VNCMLDRPETSIEYGLIAIGIAIALILVVSSLHSWTAP
jgi:Flp pilus assembly pilin Flp